MPSTVPHQESMVTGLNMMCPTILPLSSATSDSTVLQDISSLSASFASWSLPKACLYTDLTAGMSAGLSSRIRIVVFISFLLIVDLSPIYHSGIEDGL